jgi:hypothetical protein
MASLRNLILGILRLRGDRNIAAALRCNTRDATESCTAWHHQPMNQTPTTLPRPCLRHSSAMRDTSTSGPVIRLANRGQREV